MRACAALAIFCVTAVLAFSGEIRTAERPPEARQALEQIKAGGPFSFPNDGKTFNSREARLPKRERGYCREVTLPTPDLRERGARRIVAGRGGEFYYTDDHYRTFKRIIE